MNIQNIIIIRLTWLNDWMNDLANSSHQKRKKTTTTTIRNKQNKKKSIQSAVPKTECEKEEYFSNDECCTPTQLGIGRMTPTLCIFVCFMGKNVSNMFCNGKIACLLTCIHQLTCYIDRWLLRPEFDRNVMLWCFDDDDGPMDRLRT